jgi:acyl carrier protein
MPSSTIEDRLREAIVEQLNVDPKLVTRDASFRNDLGLLDEIELLMILEDSFKDELTNLPDGLIPDVHAKKLSTFGHALDYVQSGGRTIPC